MRARDNPFRSERADNVPYIFRSSSLSELLDRLEVLNYQAEVSGPHGSGKTTLLDALEGQLNQRGWTVKRIFLNSESPVLPPGFTDDFAGSLCPRDIVFLDGADELTRTEWERFRSAVSTAAGLIVTTHDGGLLPCLIRCGTTVALVHRIIALFVEDYTDEMRLETERLYIEHGGNVRNVIRSWYDMLSGPVSNGKARLP